MPRGPTERSGRDVRGVRPRASALNTFVRRLLSLVGLGLMAGAVLHPALGAQVRDTIPKRRDTTLVIPIKPGADSLLRDSLREKRDSLRMADSLRARFRATRSKRHSRMPRCRSTSTIGRRLHWNRDSLFATGAITLADLVERVQGATVFRAGWIAAPATSAYLGDMRRTRVFYDGFEITSLDPHERGALDLTQVNLWSVEDAVIEQGADEMRIYLRSWRVRNTTAVTRTDVSTGDQQTNLYRGLYGRRFDNGMALQFGAQQFGTTPPSVFGSSSDQLGLIGRFGWANRDWSADAFVTRISRHRGDIFDGLGLDTIPKVESARTDAYLRLGYRDPDTKARCVGVRVMAIASTYSYTGIRTESSLGLRVLESVLEAASLDSNVARTQYLATAGTTRGPFRLSGTARMFVSEGRSIFSPSMRGSYAFNGLLVSGFAESKSADSAARADVTAQFSPLRFVSLLGGVGRVTDSHNADSSFTTNYLRAELGLRFRNLWFIGGMVRRDSVSLVAPRIFDTLFAIRGEPQADRSDGGRPWTVVAPDQRRFVRGALERLDGVLSSAIPDAKRSIREDEHAGSVSERRSRNHGVGGSRVSFGRAISGRKIGRAQRSGLSHDLHVARDSDFERDRLLAVPQHPG